MSRKFATIFYVEIRCDTDTPYQEWDSEQTDEFTKLLKWIRSATLARAPHDYGQITVTINDRNEFEIEWE